MTTAAELTVSLAERIRDPQYTAISETQWCTILSHAQSTWGALTGRIIDTDSFPTEALCPIYTVQDCIPDCIEIKVLRDGDNYLQFTPYDTLRAMDSGWLRTVGPKPEQWSLIGRDLLIVYPSCETITTLTAAYVAHPVALQPADAVVLSPHDLPGFLDLAEALGALRMRNLKQAEGAYNRIKDRLGLK